MTQPARRPSPRAQVERAKALLVSASDHRPKNPVAEIVREHPLPVLGLVAAAGFAVVAIKPGRLLMRQVLLAGTGIMLRKALVKYVRSS